MNWNDLLLEFLDWISIQNPIFIWLFFFFSNFLENVFPPWPGDTVTVFGGFFVAQTIEQDAKFGIFYLITATLLGNYAGAVLMYKFGHRFLNIIRHKNFPFKKELYDEERIHQTFHWFRKNSILVIILSRFSAGIRFFVSIIAGMSHLNFYLFSLLYNIAVILWCGLLILGGYSVGKNWNTILEYLDLYNKIIGTIIVLIILFFLIKKIYQLNQKK